MTKAVQQLTDLTQVSPWSAYIDRYKLLDTPQIICGGVSAENDLDIFAFFEDANMARSFSAVNCTSNNLIFLFVLHYYLP